MRDAQDLAQQALVAVSRALPTWERRTELDSQIEREYRRQMFRQAAEVVRSRADEITWQAFALTMIDGLTIAQAAEQLDKAEAVIYAARSRIMRRLRDAVKGLEDDKP